MKILRSVTRRGFSLGTAGWFTVLRPNTWFAASRLPRNFRYRGSQSADVVGYANSWAVTSEPRIAIPNTQDRRLMPTAFVVLAAIAITSALLWWIMYP